MLLVATVLHTASQPYCLHVYNLLQQLREYIYSLPLIRRVFNFQRRRTLCLQFSLLYGFASDSTWGVWSLDRAGCCMVVRGWFHRIHESCWLMDSTTYRLNNIRANRHNWSVLTFTPSLGAWRQFSRLLAKKVCYTIDKLKFVSVNDENTDPIIIMIMDR